MIKNLDHKSASDSDTTCPSITEGQNRFSAAEEQKALENHTKKGLCRRYRTGSFEFNLDYLKNRSDANQVRHAGKAVGKSSKTVQEKRSLYLR